MITVRALVPTRVHPLRVYASAFAIMARNLRVVVPVVVVATFIPAAIEIFVAHELPRGVAGLLTTTVDTFAAGVFAGAAEQLVHRWEEGERHIPLKGVLSRVPPVIFPLLAVVILQSLAVAVGFLLLIVPGFVIWTYFAVVGPVVVAENPGIRKSFRRSRCLVRGNGWRVFAVLFSLELLAGLVAFVIGLIFTSIGETGDNPIALAIGESLTLPLEVLAVAVMYWRLREVERARLSAAEEAVADAPAAG